jgi:hypothetical protein
MADKRTLGQLKGLEAKITQDWQLLSTAIRIDLANIWLEREEHEIEEIHVVLERLSNSTSFISFLHRLDSAFDDHDLKELIQLLTKKEITKIGAKRWYQIVHAKLNRLLRILHQEISVLEGWTYHFQSAPAEAPIRMDDGPHMVFYYILNLLDPTSSKLEGI